MGDRFDGDLLGDDPIRTSLAAARDAIRTVADVLPSGGTVHLSYGEEQMDEYVHQLAADHLVHGWDLAVATGGDARLDPALVHEVATWFADREELYRAGGVIGARGQPPPENPRGTSWPPSAGIRTGARTTPVWPGSRPPSAAATSTR